MSETTLDNRGRLTLPKEIRERYGEHYYIVKLHNSVKLVPIADDPLSALREGFSGVEKSADELRQEARREALNEAGR